MLMRDKIFKWCVIGMVGFLALFGAYRLVADFWTVRINAAVQRGAVDGLDTVINSVRNAGKFTVRVKDDKGVESQMVLVEEKRR